MSDGLGIRWFDGHNDSLLRAHDRGLPEDGFLAGAGEGGHTEGHLDLPRARRGGMFGGFYAVFVPTPRAPAVDPSGTAASADGSARGPSPQRVMTSPGREPYSIPLTPPVAPERAALESERMVERLERLERAADEAGPLFLRVRSADDLERARAEGRHAVLLHFEGAEAIEPDLSNLENWFERGLRSIGPVWSRSNAFGHGVPFAWPASPEIGDGLSAAGRELVRRCNDLGVLVDCAHLNAAGFWDVARTTCKPLVSTHTAVHRLSEKPRNLLDDQIEEVARTHGVVGLNFNCADIRSDGRWLRDTPLECYAEHLEYLAERLGEDGVALGSDFDGALMPAQMPDVASVPRLFELLRTRGWGEQQLEKLAWRNWQRILGQTIGSGS